ncbi:MAG: M20/M25/M40 family metallo-hydrolase [Lachnospiraceae bacterium]
MERMQGFINESKPMEIKEKTIMKESLEQYAENRLPQMKQTLEELVLIPAPSFSEQERAQYCLKWLETNGVTDAYIDKYDNVIISYPPMDRERKKQSYACLFLAHLDTVFSAETKLELKKESDCWSCPGIGDDTANVVMLLELIRYLFSEKPCIGKPFLFALNTGEEGLGNLKGSRGVMREYAGQIEQVVAFDLYQSQLYIDCVGSVRYRIEVRTEGGHSWLDFGKTNAIERMSAILQELYRYQPQEAAKITYNVGLIEGGTSVNTIASSGSFLFEFRSESAEAMRRGNTYLREVLEKYCGEGMEVCCSVVGERPCSEYVDGEKQGWLACGCSQIMEEVTGRKPEEGSASTDCNIPLSMGIPAVCMGLIDGGRAHTLEEWVRPSSMADGLVIAVRTAQLLAIRN